MCLVAFQIRKEAEDYGILVCANRDEFFNRPTRELHSWEDGVLAGRDLEAGGTWMGIGPGGRVAFLTNFRDLNNIRKDVRSRGGLVADFLTSKDPSEKYLETISKSSKEYNGFNLVVGSNNGFYYFSNEEEEIRQLEVGIYGLSNGILDEPWPKVSRVKREFGELVMGNSSEQDFFKVMKNTDTYPDDQLPSTGADLDLERGLSAMFIRLKGYGSRVSSLLDFKTENDFRFWERTYDFPGNEVQTKFYFSGSSKLLSTTISPS